MRPLSTGAAPRSWGAVVGPLATACAIALATLTGGVAFADPSTTSPTPVPSSSAPVTTETTAGTEPSTSPTESSTSLRTQRVLRELKLSADEGAPGDSFSATAFGFGACGTISFLWDGHDEIGSGASTTSDAATNAVTANLEVPNEAEPGGHWVLATCGQEGGGSERRPFNVVAPEVPPALSLEPKAGIAGTAFTATVEGFGSCVGADVSFQWGDGEPLEYSAIDGHTTYRFEVPRAATPMDYTITASCGNQYAPATFTVLPLAAPNLTLGAGHGTPGSQLTASGTGFACTSGDVQLRWGSDVLTDAPSGTFAVRVTIPVQATAGEYAVTAACRNDPDIADTEPFTVTSVTTAVTEPPALTLDPSSGRGGDRVRAVGDRIACASRSGPVSLSWDDGTPLPDVTLDASGHFGISVFVPTTADHQRLTLRATCADGVVLAADFTLLGNPSAPPPAPPPKARIPWLPILVVAAVVLAAAEFVRRRLRHRGSPQPVQVVPRPDDIPTITLRETPQRGETSYALRLETHAGVGTLTVREVDDDHTAR